MLARALAAELVRLNRRRILPMAEPAVAAVAMK